MSCNLYLSVCVFVVEKLMEAGDKFTREAIDVLRPEPVTAPESGRFVLRGKKLYAILGGIVLLAIFAVFGKIRGRGEMEKLMNIFVVLYKLNKQ